MLVNEFVLVWDVSLILGVCGLQFIYQFFKNFPLIVKSDKKAFLFQNYAVLCYAV
jgi:putative Mn2+ efflux pump MntP